MPCAHTVKGTVDYLVTSAGASLYTLLHTVALLKKKEKTQRDIKQRMRKVVMLLADLHLAWKNSLLL